MARTKKETLNIVLMEDILVRNAISGRARHIGIEIPRALIESICQNASVCAQDVWDYVRPSLKGNAKYKFQYGKTDYTSMIADLWPVIPTLEGNGEVATLYLLEKPEKYYKPKTPYIVHETPQEPQSSTQTSR